MLLEIAVRIRMRLKKLKMDELLCELERQFPPHVRVPFRELTASNFETNSR
jgi:hypothetical protein